MCYLHEFYLNSVILQNLFETKLIVVPASKNDEGNWVCEATVVFSKPLRSHIVNQEFHGAFGGIKTFTSVIEGNSVKIIGVSTSINPNVESFRYSVTAIF